MNTSTPNTCQKCGKPIMDGSPRGLCPMCLISAVAKSDEPVPTNAPSPELDDLRPAFPQLEILETLGAGGMGRVYKVRQPNLDRIVALKLLPPAYAADPEWIERFTREARALARLNHPNIVQVYDFGETAPNETGERFPFLLMEFVDGVNLRQALRTGALTAREALTIVPSVCAALQYAHDQGVLHRDIKPENILLDTQGRVKIADFGLAKLGGDSAPGLTLTGTGAQLGTAAYMAPEQIEKPHDVDHRADIYSLGVVFYELLTGELPLGRFPAPSEKAGTDPRLDTIVFRTLEKERDRRFQTATDMRTEVENVANHPAPEPTPAPKYGPDEWMVRCASCGRTGALAAVGGVRIGAASIGKRTIIRCSQCGGLREGIIAKLRDLPPDTVPVAPVTPAASKSAQGRKRALIGAWLHLVPLILGICFLPLWFDMAAAIVNMRVTDTMLFEEIFPRFGARLAAFIIPSALALVAGDVLTLVALLGDRFRARWFFWWNILHWTALSFLFVGILPLIYVLAKWREFFPRLATATQSEVSSSPIPAASARNPWPRRVFLLIAALVIVPAGLIGVGLIMPYLALQAPRGMLTARPTADVVTAEHAPFIGRLPEGSIELVAISHHPAIGEPSWKMDGSPATVAAVSNPVAEIAAKSGERAFVFLFHVNNLPEGTRLLETEVANSEGWSCDTQRNLEAGADKRINRNIGLTARLPAKSSTADIRVGFGFGEWETIFDSGSQSVGGSSPLHEGVRWKLGWSAAIETKDGEIISNWNVKPNRDWESRVVAVKNNGEIVATNNRTTGQDQTEWRFSSVPMHELKTFYFQVRRVQWVEFRGIKLAPSGAVAKSTATAADFDLHQNMTEKSEDSIEAQWLAGSDSPGWVTARFGEFEQSTQMRRGTDGRYKAQVHARLTLSRTPGWARLELTTDDGTGQKAKDDINFEEPSRGWFAKVFADTAKDGLHKRGTIPLLQIGTEPVTLTVSNDHPAPTRPSFAAFALTEVYCVAMDARNIALGVEWESESRKGPELFVRSEKLGEPAVTERDAVVSGVPAKRQRRAWQLALSDLSPELATDAGRDALKKRIAEAWLDKPTPIRVGEEKLIFSVPLADGKEGRVFLATRPRGGSKQ